jgi:hypothetical protein
MQLMSGFGLLQRMIIWVSLTPTGIVMQAELPVILEDVRQMHPPNPELGSLDEVWQVLRQMEQEDAELGELNQWRSFVILGQGYDNGNVTDINRTPNAIRFICPRTRWA